MRYERTEKMILDALICLLKKHTMSEISIKELCAEAGISRNAFYAHYSDKYDLLRHLAKKFINEMVTRILCIPVGTPFSEAISKCAQITLNCFDSNLGLATILIKNETDFLTLMQQAFEGITLRFVPNNERLKFFARYSSNAICCCVIQFYLGQIRLDKDEFIKYLSEIAKTSNSFINEFIVPNQT